MTAQSEELLKATEPESTETVSADEVIFDASQLNQTRFAEDIVIEDYTGDPSPSDIPVAPPKPLEPWKIVAGVLGLLLVVTTLVLIFLPSDARKKTPVTENTEVKDTGPKNELERQLLLLKADVEKADPIQSDLSFPPVDFRLDLQDASTVEQLRKKSESERNN